MIHTNIFRQTAIAVASFMVFIMSFAGFFVLQSAKANAVVCPDGSTAGRIDECDSVKTDPCATAEPGSEESNGCTTFKVEFDEAINKEGKYQCGKGSKKMTTGFNFGCRGEDYPEEQLNPIVDLAFSIFRFLSAGVGIVVIGSIVLAGIQYTMARGNPQSTQAAITRVASSVTALLIYLFIFAIANFLVPGGMFI